MGFNWMLKRNNDSFFLSFFRVKCPCSQFLLAGARFSDFAVSLFVVWLFDFFCVLAHCDEILWVTGVSGDKLWENDCLFNCLAGICSLMGRDVAVLAIDFFFWGEIRDTWWLEFLTFLNEWFLWNWKGRILILCFCEWLRWNLKCES